MHGLDGDPYPLLYWPLEQFPSINAWLVVRAPGDPRSIAQATRTAINRFDADLAVSDVVTMETVVADSMWRQRFATVLIGLFAALALLLATAGIYAVIAYSVSQRTREIGIRVALGAQRSELTRMFVRSGLLLASLGVPLGLVAAVALSRLMSSLLFGVSPLDPLTYSAVPLVLLAAVVTASYLPARCAASVDPVDALKAE
jgi:ABC-type antimicrobial peptide transport system permease subunit